jgi:hypothetical protein
MKHIKLFQDFLNESNDLRPQTVGDLNKFFKSKGIKERIVHDRKNGYFYFIDGNSETWDSTGVYTYRVNQMTYDMWLDEYETLKNK